MNWFKKKSEVVIPDIVEEKQVERKSTPASYVSYLFSAFGEGIGQTYLPPLTAYKFFHKIGPLHSTIDRIAGVTGELPLTMRNEDKIEETDKDADVLVLLNAPSKLTTKKLFWEDCAKSVMLTKELWIVARGFRNSAPDELVFIHPYNVQIFDDPSSSWPLRIYTNVIGDRRYYKRENVGGRYRYFDEATGLNEIFPYISGRNVSGNSGFFRAVSPLSSIKDELLSYSSSIVGNTASIENAGRPSGIISPTEELSDTQWEDLQESMNEISGPQNNGKITLLPTNVTAAFDAWAPKDMEYPELQKNVKMNIWNLYYVPLPLVNDATQTFNNVETSELSLYDNAVAPVFAEVADALKWALSTRYDLTGWKISFNEFEVPALKRRAVKNMKELTESQVLSVNEIRSSGGYEDTPDGDSILVGSNKTTLNAVVEAPSFEVPPKETVPKDVITPNQKQIEAFQKEVLVKKIAAETWLKISFKAWQQLVYSSFIMQKRDGATIVFIDSELKNNLTTLLTDHYYDTFESFIFGLDMDSGGKLDINLDINLDIHKEDPEQEDSDLAWLLLLIQRSLRDQIATHLPTSVSSIIDTTTQIGNVSTSIAQSTGGSYNTVLANKLAAKTTTVSITETTWAAETAMSTALHHTTEVLNQMPVSPNASPITTQASIRKLKALQKISPNVTLKNINIEKLLRETSVTMNNVMDQLTHPKKEWISVGDGRVRPSHVTASGTILNLHEAFMLPGGLLMYPTDGSLGASLSERINCRCWAMYF